MQTSEPTEIQNDPLYRNIFMPNLLDFNLSVLTKINFWGLVEFDFKPISTRPRIKFASKFASSKFFSYKKNLTIILEIFDDLTRFIFFIKIDLWLYHVFLASSDLV